MLNLLTKYLLHYKRVSIPSVGTITLVQQPAQLNVVDKIILPPGYAAEFSRDEALSDHQVLFLAAALQEEPEAVLQRLHNLGQHLNKQINEEGFYWKGIGLLRNSPEPMPLSFAALNPVVAERVLRPDAEHAVLVGDQQRTSTGMAVLKEEVVEVAKKERSLFIIIGWVVLLLAIAYIVFVLYQGRFRIGSTGSRQAPTSSLKLYQEGSCKTLTPLVAYRRQA